MLLSAIPYQHEEWHWLLCSGSGCSASHCIQITGCWYSEKRFTADGPRGTRQVAMGVAGDASAARGRGAQHGRPWLLLRGRLAVSTGLVAGGESWLWRAHLRAPKGTMPPREKAALEVFKFAVYLAVPISLTVLVAYNRPMLEAVIKNRMYVVYPPEGPRPPTNNEELYEHMRRMQERQGSSAASGKGGRGDA